MNFLMCEFTFLLRSLRESSSFKRKAMFFSLSRTGTCFLESLVTLEFPWSSWACLQKRQKFIRNALILDSQTGNKKNESHSDMQLSNTQGMRSPTFKNITVTYLLWDISQIIQLTFKVILKYYCTVLQGKLLPSCSQEFDSVLIKEAKKMHWNLYLS